MPPTGGSASAAGAGGRAPRGARGGEAAALATALGVDLSQLVADEPVRVLLGGAR
jgi:hypothetical protein